MGCRGSESSMRQESRLDLAQLSAPAQTVLRSSASGHHANIFSIAFTRDPSASHLLSCGMCGSISVWDVERQLNLCSSQPPATSLRDVCTQETPLLKLFGSEGGSMHRLALLPSHSAVSSSPFVFWSASDPVSLLDPSIRLWDLRCSSRFRASLSMSVAPTNQPIYSQAQSFVNACINRASVQDSLLYSRCGIAAIRSDWLAASTVALAPQSHWLMAVGGARGVALIDQRRLLSAVSHTAQELCHNSCVLCEFTERDRAFDQCHDHVALPRRLRAQSLIFDHSIIATLAPDAMSHTVPLEEVIQPTGADPMDDSQSAAASPPADREQNSDDVSEWERMMSPAEVRRINFRGSVTSIDFSAAAPLCVVHQQRAGVFVFDISSIACCSSVPLSTAPPRLPPIVFLRHPQFLSAVTMKSAVFVEMPRVQGREDCVSMVLCGSDSHELHCWVLNQLPQWKSLRFAGKCLSTHLECDADLPFHLPDFDSPSPSGSTIEMQSTHQLLGHRSICNHVVFDAMRKRLFTCGVEKVVRVWDVCSGQSMIRNVLASDSQLQKMIARLLTPRCINTALTVDNTDRIGYVEADEDVRVIEMFDDYVVPSELSEDDDGDDSDVDIQEIEQFLRFIGRI